LSPAKSAQSPSKPRRRGGKGGGRRGGGGGRAVAGEADSLEGKVISQLLKQAQDCDSTNKELQLKYRKVAVRFSYVCPIWM
jgi:hypothetical protein